MLYANASNDIINRNGTLSGGTVQLVAGNDVLSKTQIAWGDKASTGIHSAGALTLNAGRDIELAGTQVTAKGTTTLDAGRNLTLTASQYTGLPANAAAASVTSSLNTTGDALLTAKQDLTLNRSTVNAGGTAALIAGRDLTISSGAGAINATTPTTGGAPVPGVWLKGHSTTTGHGTQQQLEVAGVNAGSQLVLSAGRDANLNAAQVTAGEDLIVIAKRDINASTVATTETHTTTTVAKKSSGWITQVDQTAHGTLLGAQGNVTLNAGQDVSLQGASVNAKTGEASISAVRDVNLTAAQETHETHSQTTKKSGNFWNDTETRTFDTVKDSIAVGTTVSGETVKIKAGNDVLVQGGQVVGTKDVAVTAGNDLKVLNATNTREEDHRTVKTTEGVLYSGGISVMKGVRQTTQDMKATETSTAASVIGSSEGRVGLYAGNAVQVKGSDVLSQAGTSISGKTVTVEANEEVRNQRDSTRFREDGAKIALTGQYAKAANGVIQTYNDYKSTENDRLKALYAANGTYNAYKEGKALFGKKSQNDAAASGAAKEGEANKENQKGSSSWGIAITGSHQQSDTHIDTQVTSQRGSQIQSGGDIDITAREGDLKVVGSTIDGQNVTLDAAKNLILQSSESALAQKQKTESWGAEAGIALKFGNGASLGFHGAANVGNDKTDQNGATHNETIVNAAKTLTLKSGGDTTLQGAQAKGEKVVANVGGDLNLVSEQDSDKFRNTNWSFQGEVTVGWGADYSLSASAGQIKSDYASVQEKTGIAAGKEGFDITVGGNTHLKGADIASQADADKNKLSTNSLTAENIDNVAKYKAASVSVSTSGGSPSGGMGIPQDKDKRSTTTSGIAQGTIEVRNGDNSALASLDRNVTDLSKSNALKPIFDFQDVKDNQKAGEVAGKLAFTVVGDIAQARQNAAQSDLTKAQEDYERAKNSGSVDAMKEASTRIDQASKLLVSWKDGGAKKVALHTIAAAIAAAAGNGDIAGAMAGAALNERLAATTNKIDSAVLRQFASLVIGSVGGGAGSSAALSGEVYNRQLHETEILYILMAAEGFKDRLAAEGTVISESDAVARLMAQALRRTDTAEISNRTTDLAADAYLSLLSSGKPAFRDQNGNLYKLFQASSPQEKADHALFAETKTSYGALYDIARASKPQNNAWRWELPLGITLSNENLLIQDLKARFAYFEGKPDKYKMLAEAGLIGVVAEAGAFNLIRTATTSSAIAARELLREGPILYCLARPGTCSTAGAFALEAMAGTYTGYNAIPVSPMAAEMNAARAELNAGRLSAEQYLSSISKINKKYELESIEVTGFSEKHTPNAVPYNPQKWRVDLQETYPNVRSTTVPPFNAPNVKLAGQKHPVTGIVFDNRGFPIFDDVAYFDVRFTSQEFRAISYEDQMRAASRDLWQAIERGEVSSSRFNAVQLEQIKKGEAHIEGLTWHHHQDYGRMQLVPRDVHKKTGHIGGDGMKDGK